MRPAYGLTLASTAASKAIFMMLNGPESAISMSPEHDRRGRRVQPFGGMGLSGTGLKAGGPDYLRRLQCEQTVTMQQCAQSGKCGPC